LIERGEDQGDACAKGGAFPRMDMEFPRLPLFKIPSAPELQHGSSELPVAGETKSERTGRRSACKLHLVQNTAHASVVFVSCALASVHAWILCNRHCNQAVMELYNSMHLVDKNLRIVP